MKRNSKMKNAEYVYELDFPPSEDDVRAAAKLERLKRYNARQQKAAEKAKHANQVKIQ